MDFLSDEEFDALFHSFKHTAFRLEQRESYVGVSYSATPFGRWLTGDSLDQSWMNDWLENIRAVKAANKRFERVRVVSEPWSDYNRYGLWACRVNAEAGEDIRYLSRSRATQASLPDEDYWLFDSRFLIRLHYDENDDWVGAERVEDWSEIVQHNYWRDVAWHHAVPRDMYVEQAGGEVFVGTPREQIWFGQRSET